MVPLAIIRPRRKVNKGQVNVNEVQRRMHSMCVYRASAICSQILPGRGTVAHAPETMLSGTL